MHDRKPHNFDSFTARTAEMEKQLNACRESEAVSSRLVANSWWLLSQSRASQQGSSGPAATPCRARWPPGPRDSGSPHSAPRVEIL